MSGILGSLYWLALAVGKAVFELLSFSVVYVLSSEQALELAMVVPELTGWATVQLKLLKLLGDPKLARTEAKQLAELEDQISSSSKSFLTQMSLCAL